MTVGEKIRKFRIDQGYTQKELAIMSGLRRGILQGSGGYTDSPSYKRNCPDLCKQKGQG